MKLTNQEIRNAVYSGSFNNFLQSLNSSSAWSSILKKTTGQKNTDDRFRSLELLLKFFAFHGSISSYNGRLNLFLNEYMQKNRNKEDGFLDEKRALFNKTIQFVDKNLFVKKSSTRLSAVVFETLLYGVSKNIPYLEGLSENSLQGTMKKFYNNFLSREIFSSDNLREGIYKKQKVIERMRVAEAEFSGNRS